MENELETYVKVRKDEYDELKELERKHRYLLSGELSYSNSVNKKLQDLKEWLEEEINTLDTIYENLTDAGAIKRQTYKEVLERLI